MSRRERVIAALRPHAVGLALCVAYVLLLVNTARHLGFARDEGFYFHAATSYANWFRQLLEDRHGALTRGSIDAAWGVNHEHPSLMKSLFGLSWLFLHEKWHLIHQKSLAFRLPGMVMGGLGLWVTYIFGRRAHSHRAGLFAALALACLPRVFYHAHLDCFDVPVMTMWVLVLYCYWRSLSGGIAWAVLTGLTWGLALETKHNAWFVPFLVVAHFLVTRLLELKKDAQKGKFPIPLALIFMVVLGPLVFVALWPWMWFDTLSNPAHGPGRFQEYVAFHTGHAYYNMEFMGYNWFRPPFPRTYSWGMILFTVPFITLLLGALGLARKLPAMVREASWLAAIVPQRFRAHLGEPEGTDGAGTWVLVFMGFLVPLAPWFSSKTPIFGGTKHWFPAYPFLAILAGVGFAWAARALADALGDRVRRAWLPPVALGSVLLLPAFAQTAHSHPFGLSNYTPVAGGAPGSADLGLNRQFWGFTTGSLVPWFNRHAPPRAGVYIHDTTFESWSMLQQDGYLREDLNPVWQLSDAHFSIVHHELHMNEVDYQIWTAYGHPNPVEVLTYDGVPIVSVYANPRR